MIFMPPNQNFDYSALMCTNFDFPIHTCQIYTKQVAIMHLYRENQLPMETINLEMLQHLEHPCFYTCAILYSGKFGGESVW